MVAAAFLLGVVGTILYDGMASANVKELGGFFGRMLYIGFAAGGGLSLLGVFLRGTTGALLERAGLLALSFHCLAYSATAFAIAGIPRALGFSIFVTAFAAANLWRVHQIGREIREHQAVQDILGGRM